MSDSGPSKPKDDDDLIRQWRAKRAKTAGEDTPATPLDKPTETDAPKPKTDTLPTTSAKAESSSPEPTKVTSSAERATQSGTAPAPARSVPNDNDDLLAYTEGLLAGPKPDLSLATPIPLDAIREGSSAPRATRSDRSTGRDRGVGALGLDDLAELVRPRGATDGSRETADAVARAFAGAQATGQTHIPGGNEIEEARALMHARLKQRRAKSLGLLALTVLLPILAMLTYLQFFVTPLYEAHAVIAITQPNQQGQTGGGGVLGALGGGAGMSQAFKADEYVRSRALVQDLVSERWAPQLAAVGLAPQDILAPQPLKTMVDSSIDIQAGLMTIYTRMATPEKAVALSGLVLDLVADHVDVLGSQLLDQRLLVVGDSVENAREDLQEARRDMVELQISTGDVDPGQRVSATYIRIAEIETEISDLRAQIDRTTVSGENAIYETERLRALIEKLTDQAETARRSLVDGNGNSASLNRLLMDFELAAQNVMIAEETLSSALTAWARTQTEVALERSVMQVVVPMLEPESPRYPRILVNLLITAIIGMAAFFTLRMALLDPE